VTRQREQHPGMVAVGMVLYGILLAFTWANDLGPWALTLLPLVAILLLHLYRGGDLSTSPSEVWENVKYDLMPGRYGSGRE